MSGTLSEEWQRAGDRHNYLGCRQRVREFETGLMGYRPAPSESAWIAAGQKPVHPFVSVRANPNTVHLRARAVDFGLQSLCSSATRPLYLVVNWTVLPLSGKYWG